MSDKKMIKFIHSNYDLLFTVPDGGEIIITYPDGEEYQGTVRYIDPYHFSLNGKAYHISQFAGIMENAKATIREVL